jgi:hypothetical protein
VTGLECDEPAGKRVLGVYANLLYPCPANRDEQNPNVFALFNNDDPGTILDIYRSASASTGTHTSTSRAPGDYQLTYTIRRG